MTPPVLRLRGAEVRVAGVERPLLRVPDLVVAAGQHWAVIGGNGAGKSTLLALAAGRLAPATGSVELFGDAPGAPGLRDPRLRVSLLEGAPRAYAPELTGLDVVVLRQGGPAALLGQALRPADRDHARELLDVLDAGHLAARRYGSCSEGERQRILLARALLRDPALLLLDEPVAALDLPGREALLRAVERLADRRPALASITVTHHLEELPASTTHALLLRAGDIVGSGPADAVLSPGPLSECFGVDVDVVRADGRWMAQLRRSAA